MNKAASPMEYHCPKEIIKIFDDGDLSQGRQKVVDWLYTLKMIEGDIVWIPNADGNEMISFIYVPQRRVN